MRNACVLMAAILTLGVLLASSNAFAATDGVYNLSEAGAAWDGTDAGRLQAVSADYDHTYGDEDSLSYTLPWTFTFYGQPYSHINADTNGNIWFASAGSASSFSLPNAGRGPVISAWNNDLSSYYYTGVFVQHKTNPERVVVEWQTESFTDEGYYLLNDFEAVLFQSGDVRFDYKSFNPSTLKDFGSGISKDDSMHYLDLSATYGNVYSQAGRSYAFTSAGTPVYTVTAVAGANGSLDTTYRTSPQTISQGSTTSFKFDANADYYVASISGCGISYANTKKAVNTSIATTGAITADCTVAATFTQNILTLYTAGTGTGTVSGAGAYDYGAVATVAAAAGPGSKFSNWTGDCSGNTNPTTVIMNGNKTCTAIFNPIITYVLTVTAAGSGKGTVSGAGTYNDGQTATVTATALPGSTFDGWSGDCSGTSSPTTVLMNSNKTCTATFTITNDAPTMPTIISPLPSSEVTTRTPTLSVSASTDPNGDTVSYVFEVYSDSGLSKLVAGTTTTSTSWTVPDAALSDNAMYYWRALASDGSLNSPWMPTANFFVNTANDTPTDPAVSSPGNDTVVATPTPLLSVTNASDKDIYDTVTYDFEVATDSGFTNIVATMSAIAQGSAGTTSWTVTPALSEDTLYHWRARAKDNHGATSTWASAEFFVNTANNAPTAPTLNGPANAGEVTTFTPSLAVNNAADSDHDPLMYLFEIDTVNTFDSPNKQTSGLTAEGSGVTIWIPSALTENTTYYWRAKANDGITDGPWMATTSFFVNTVNEHPTAPTLNNPANNSQVVVLSPTLSVNTATDPDHDAITYEFEIYGNSDLTILVTSTTGAATSWTLDRALADNTWYWWRARARDEHGIASGWMAASSFFVNNQGYNDPPALTVPGPQAVDEGQKLTFAVSAVDPDSDLLTYSAANLPDGAIFDASTHTFTWTPGFTQAGTYTVTFTASDGTASDSKDVTITVHDVAPIHISGGAYFLHGGYQESISLDVTALSGTVQGTSWLKYYYSKTRMYFVSSQITAATVNGNVATITGTGTVNGSPGYTFTATVIDGALDRFGITILRLDGTLYYQYTQSIAGGDLIIQ